MHIRNWIENPNQVGNDRRVCRRPTFNQRCQENIIGQISIPSVCKMHKKDCFLLGDSNTNYHILSLRLTCLKLSWAELDRKKDPLQLSPGRIQAGYFIHCLAGKPIYSSLAFACLSLSHSWLENFLHLGNLYAVMLEVLGARGLWKCKYTGWPAVFNATEVTWTVFPLDIRVFSGFVLCCRSNR